MLREEPFNTCHFTIFLSVVKKHKGESPKKNCPSCLSKSASIIIMRKSESNRLISIYCFHLFCHFLFLYNFNFLLSVIFSETIWILSFLSDICDVTLACYDGGCCNVLRIEYPDSWHFKEGKFWGFEYTKSWEFQIDLKVSKFRMLESSNQNNFFEDLSILYSEISGLRILNPEFLKRGNSWGFEHPISWTFRI